MHDNDKNWCDAIIHYNTIQFIAQEPPRNLHHLFQDPAYIFKSFTTTFPKTYHKISAILTDLQEDFPERLSRTANFAEHFVYIVYPFQGNLRNPPHPAGNRRANRRNLLNLETDLLFISSLEVGSVWSGSSRDDKVSPARPIIVPPAAIRSRSC